MNDDRKIAAESRHIFNFALLNSEVTAPIFTKISHDVEALVQLSIRAFTKLCCILFRNAKAKNEDGQFWRLQKGPKVNWLP